MITDEQIQAMKNYYSTYRNVWGVDDIPEWVLVGLAEVYEQSKWHLAKDVPYDTPVLFYTKCGNYVQDFIYDSGVPKLYTHFCHMIPPKE